MCDLVDKYDSFGYFVFFDILGIYAREFKTKPGWKLKVSWAYLRKKLQQTRNKRIENVLLFLELSGEWDVVLNKDDVEIVIPKFTKILDESTMKKLRAREQNSGINPERLRTKDKDTEGMEVVSSLCSKTTSCQESIIEIPLKAEHGTYNITQAEVDEWQKALPEMKVLQELERLRLWNKDHPNRRKTRASIRRHVTSWLKRASEDSKINLDKKTTEGGVVWDNPL